MAKEKKEVKKKEQTERDKKLWKDIKEKLDAGLEDRRGFEGQWVLNLAFYAGKQYVKFSSTLHALQALKNPKGKRRRVDNQLLPKVRRQISDLIKNKPQFSVVPASTDNEDIEAARSGQKVFEHFFRVNKMRKKLRQLAGWIYVCGNGFLDDRWNPKLGPTELGPDGELRYQGDADVGVWSPFEIVVPAGFAGDPNLDAFPWLIKIKWRDLEWIKHYYPKFGDQVTAESKTQPLYNLSGMFSSTMGNMEPTTEDGAYVIEFYQQPDQVDKEGLFITCANGIVLEKDTWPFDHYSLEQFKDIDVPGVFWGKATMEDAIPLQVRWNITINNIDEHIRVMGKGKWLEPRGSNMSVLVDDTHGERITYDPIMGHIPQHLTLKGLPDSYDKTLQTIQLSLDNLFSQHEVSRGTNKSDIRSGEMVALLQEQDAHGKIPSHMVFEESFEAVGRRILKRIQAGYTTERMIQTVGRDGEFEVFSFKGSDLRNNTDLVVKTQSSLPDSRIARQAIIEGRYEKGMYGNPQDPRVQREVMQQLDDALIEPLYHPRRNDEGVAKWENKLLLAGKPIAINEYDDHSAHLDCHNAARKDLDYQKRKADRPEEFLKMEQIFYNHTIEHQKGLKAQQEAMLKMQMEAQEMTKGKGGESK